MRPCRRSAVTPINDSNPLPVPLRPSDKEITLEMQPLIDTCCERGGYGASDYAPPLEPPLSPEDAAWAEALLREYGLRGAR